MQPARSLPAGKHRQQRDLETAAAELFERIEHGGMLGRNADDMFAPLSASLPAAPRMARLLLSVAPLVKTISRAAAPMACGDLFPRGFDRLLRAMAERMRRAAGDCRIFR